MDREKIDSPDLELELEFDQLDVVGGDDIDAPGLNGDRQPIIAPPETEW